MSIRWESELIDTREFRNTVDHPASRVLIEYCNSLSMSRTVTPNRAIRPFVVIQVLECLKLFGIASFKVVKMSLPFDYLMCSIAEECSKLHCSVHPFLEALISEN